VRSKGKRKKESSFCEQKEAKKLYSFWFIAKAESSEDEPN
jgi:hypothetical protein